MRLQGDRIKETCFFWFVYGIKSRGDFFQNNKPFEATIFYRNYALRHFALNALLAFSICLNNTKEGKSHYVLLCVTKMINQ